MYIYTPVNLNLTPVICVYLITCILPNLNANMYVDVAGQVQLREALSRLIIDSSI